MAKGQQAEGKALQRRSAELPGKAMASEQKDAVPRSFATFQQPDTLSPQYGNRLIASADDPISKFNQSDDAFTLEDKS
ncbi:MAG: hypothetical protein H6656_18280 [Ardenticatenaceae bacterium]|nr:hypothetical protein [Ardenticatenaceae bacterium]